MTPLLERYLHAIHRLYKSKGHWPTFQEISEEMGRARQVVHRAIKKLESSEVLKLSRTNPVRVELIEYVAPSKKPVVDKAWWRLLLCEACREKIVQPQNRKHGKAVYKLGKARVYEALRVVEVFWKTKKRAPTAKEVGQYVLIPKAVKKTGLRMQADVSKYFPGGHVNRKARVLIPAGTASGHRYLEKLSQLGLLDKQGKPKRFHVMGVDCFKCNRSVHRRTGQNREQQLLDLIDVVYPGEKHALERALLGLLVQSEKPTAREIKDFISSLCKEDADYVTSEGFDEVRKHLEEKFQSRLKKLKKMPKKEIEDELLDT